MDAGQLRHRGLVETVSVSTSASGSRTESWSTYGSRWMFIEPISASEEVAGDRTEHRITHRVTMRYDSGITPKMRIVYEGRNLYIRSILTMDEIKKQMSLICEETTA